jgi:ribose 5-phosphate isomerase A
MVQSTSEWARAATTTSNEPIMSLSPKEQVAARAAALVQTGMTVGLGTGSTARLFIAQLGQRMKHEGLQLTLVPSSVISAAQAREAGLPVSAIENVAGLDLYVDGADEVTPAHVLLKGRGQDLVREKLLAQASHTFVVTVEHTKLVQRLGARPVPVEVLPFAVRMVERSLVRLGGHPVLRLNPAGDNVAVTSAGNLVLDTAFAAEVDVAALASALDAVPGVAEHGIFAGLPTRVLVGEADGSVREL